MRLVVPVLDRLAGYADALQRGWSPDNLRGEAFVEETLEKIRDDAAAFVASLTDREAKGAPIELPDGSRAPRLPGFQLWIWDGEFAGAIGLRWQRGTPDLPPHVLGHIGYSVVPWKRGRGYAKAALCGMLAHARDEGLPHVVLTTDPANVPSQRVITANGGVLVGRFREPAALGARERLRFRIVL